MRIARPLTVAALLLLGAPLAAQSAAPAAPIGRASGTAYDSLAARPLAGALVLTPDGRAAVVDGDGRWVLDSLPVGRVRLTLAHPALDSLGLYAEGDTVTVTAGGDAVVPLATPSFARVARRLCPRGVADDAGIVFGVLADGAGTLFEGGRVRATWTDLGGAVAALAGARRDGAAVPTLEARSDARGSYALCGVPLEQGTLVQGLTDRGGTGALEVTVGARRLLRLDLVASDVRAAAVARTAVVAGVLRDSAGRPLGGATVALVGDGASARSDAEGRYRLAALPDGSQSVEIVAVGYLPVREIIGLRAGRTTTLDAALQRAHVLPVVAVRAAAARRFQQDLERRRLLGFGTVRTAEQLARYPYVVSALQDIPGLSASSTRGQLSLAMRRIGCTPQVFVDGQLLNPERVRGSGLGGPRVSGDELSMLQSLLPGDLAGLEVYHHPMYVPIQYRSQLNRCGAVLAWTKWHAERP